MLKALSENYHFHPDFDSNVIELRHNGNSFTRKIFSEQVPLHWLHTTFHLPDK